MADVWANQWHVIPEPPATLRVLSPGEFNVMIAELRVTLQGAATGRIQWHVTHPRATLQLLPLGNYSLSRFQSHMPHCRVQEFHPAY